MVDLPARPIEVFEFTAKQFSGADVDFECCVSSGVYVRAMARDLGDSLGCGAHLRALRRVAVGQFEIGRAQQLPQLSQKNAQIGSPADAVNFLPRFYIGDAELRRKVVHGQPIPAQEGEEFHVALMSDEKLVAIAERRNNTLKPRVVLEG